MSIDARLNRLAPALTAREREILVLKAWKDETPEDPIWRRTLPNDQAREFNRLIDLMNSINVRLGAYVAVLHRDVASLQLRESWLASMVLWQEHVDEISRHVRLTVKEPITESDYEARVQEVRSEWLPVDELADLAADDYDAWTDADLETVEGWDEPVVTEQAWDRVAAEKEQELRALIASGKLPARGRGKKLEVQLSAFEDLTGHKSGAAPEDLFAYRILPNAQAEDVALERKRVQALLRTIAWQDEEPVVGGGEAVGIETLRGHVANGLAVNLAACWLSVRVVETIVEEAAEDFDGVDPLRPWARNLLDRVQDHSTQGQRATPGSADAGRAARAHRAGHSRAA
jgi:hypothetical protein